MWISPKNRQRCRFFLEEETLMQRLRVSFWLSFCILILPFIASAQTPDQESQSRRGEVEAQTGSSDMEILRYGDGSLDIQMDEVSVGTALNALSNISGLKISYRLPKPRLITLFRKDVRPEEALRLICEEGKLVYQKKEEGYFVEPQPKPYPPVKHTPQMLNYDYRGLKVESHKDGTIDLDLRSAQVSDVFDLLSQPGLAIYYRPRNLGTISLSIKNTPPEEAIRLICQNVGLIYEKKEGGYIIQSPEEASKRASQQAIRAAQNATKPESGAESNPNRIMEITQVLLKTISVDAKNELVRNMLKKLAEAAGLKVQIEGDKSLLDAMKMMAYLKDVDVAFALDQICSAARLQWRVRDDRIVITPAPHVIITGPNGAVMGSSMDNDVRGTWSVGGVSGPGGFPGGRSGRASSGGIGSAFSVWGRGGGRAGFSVTGGIGGPGMSWSTATSPFYGMSGITPSRLCSRCGKPIQPEWKFCPHCGRPMPSTMPRKAAPKKIR